MLTELKTKKVVYHQEQSQAHFVFSFLGRRGKKKNICISKEMKTNYLLQKIEEKLSC